MHLQHQDVRCEDPQQAEDIPRTQLGPSSPLRAAVPIGNSAPIPPRGGSKANHPDGVTGDEGTNTEDDNTDTGSSGGIGTVVAEGCKDDLAGKDGEDAKGHADAKELRVILANLEVQLNANHEFQCWREFSQLLPPPSCPLPYPSTLPASSILIHSLLPRWKLRALTKSSAVESPRWRKGGRGSYLPCCRSFARLWTGWLAFQAMRRLRLWEDWGSRSCQIPSSQCFATRQVS